MSAGKFQPLNPLEQVLFDALVGEKSIDDFFLFLLDADVTLASTTEVQADGSEVNPLLFTQSNGTWLGVFSALERAAPFKKQAPYCVTMKGRDFFNWYPFPHGMILNPGDTAGFELPLAGVRQLQKNLLGKDDVG